MRRALAVVVVAAFAAALVVAATVAQGRSSKPRPLPGLPAYTAGYTRWSKLNRRPIPPRASGDAHFGTKNVYASRRLRNGRYPVGTVIVKEVRRGGVVAVVAAMRKIRGFSPRNNDWQMVEWVRSSPRDRFAVLAQGQICYACHSGARRNDFVFTKR
ncbi:MAG: cytochrome P460 family protein [Actinomycetota bacterium]|nr:cytochrome P460 family protein [Actinomycetota bacterium]